MLYPERFLDAQFGLYVKVVNELKAGRKRSCWMWFVFPQLKGIGRSATAAKYALACLGDADDYLKHPVLGQRLIECTQLALTHSDKTPYEIFNSPDDLKFHSCMTVFSRVENTDSVFRQALSVFYKGQPDSLTMELLTNP